MSTVQRQQVTRERPTTDRTSSTQRPILVVVGAATSGHCRRADGFLAQVLQRRGNHETFRVVRVDADQRPELLERLALDEIPTLLVLVNGQIRARLSKPRGCAAISELLSPWLR